MEIKTLKIKEHKKDLLNLFRISFGKNVSDQLWDWKYINNPLASSEPEIIVATENGVIAGARPFLMIEMWLDNSKVVAAQHCDTMVHPEYRNRGLFNKMGSFAVRYLKEQGCALSYGFPNPKSRPGFLNQGYRIVAPTETLFRPVNARKLITQRVNNKFVGDIAGFLYNKLLNPGIEQINQAEGLVAEVSGTYKEELKEMDGWQSPAKIDLVRSETNLKWRFDLHPEQTYKYVLLKKDGELLGYAVISVQEQHHEQKRGFIIDYRVKEDDVTCFLALMELSIHELVKSDCDIVAMWAPGDLNLKINAMKRSGLKSFSQFPYSKLSEYGYMDVLLIDERLAGRIDIYNKDNWRMTHAFADFV